MWRILINSTDSHLETKEGTTTQPEHVTKSGIL